MPRSPEQTEAMPTIQNVFHAACHRSGLSRMPVRMATVGRSRPIQKSSVKLDQAKFPGWRITVDSASVRIGRQTAAMKKAVAKPVAGSRHVFSRDSRFIEPLEPTVTKRRASLASQA